MTRFLLVGMVLGSAILLSACGEDQVQEAEIEELEEIQSEEIQEEPAIEETAVEEVESQPVEAEPAEEVTEPVSSAYGTLTEDTVRSVIGDFLYNAGDLQTLSFQNGHISIDVTGLGSADEAANWYMQLSDELLFYDGLQSLTVQFAPYGTVGFSVNEAETSDFGAYFPYEEIEEQLGITYDW
ncbi:hypothetical protein [Lysinibacillus sp. 3P01SB]|uniref:hypothetical protein n=1 Tax=Lysinibacillus sp. 3P01SB TaxID=3132284 RepID=UPI0039A4D7DD